MPLCYHHALQNSSLLGSCAMNKTFHLARGLLTVFLVCIALVAETAAQADLCPRGKIETSITFRNDRSSPVTYHWVNAQCKEVLHKEIQPHAEVTVRTYAAEVWRVRDKASKLLLQDTAAGMAPLRVRVTDPERTMNERDDDLSGFQVKVLYVLPRDGVDRGLDTNSSIVLSVAAIQQWVLQQTGGKRLRFDTYQGALDIGFLRLDRSDAELKRRGAEIRDEIELDLGKAGFKHKRKLYLVYYDCDATECGGGPAITKPGSVAAIYLRGLQGACERQLAKDVAVPTLAEYGALHEILHGLGFVQDCARNRTKERTCRHNRRRVTKGHVSDSPKDLMYAGCEPWRPTMLDVDRNDYFNHRIPGCLDLNNSAFLEWPGEPPPGWD
jgi:hypothetical protein